jgi:hypothetical protein
MAVAVDTGNCPSVSGRPEATVRWTLSALRRGLHCMLAAVCLHLELAMMLVGITAASPTAACVRSTSPCGLCPCGAADEVCGFPTAGCAFESRSLPWPEDAIAEEAQILTIGVLYEGAHSKGVVREADGLVHPYHLAGIYRFNWNVAQLFTSGAVEGRHEGAWFKNAKDARQANLIAIDFAI